MTLRAAVEYDAAGARRGRGSRRLNNAFGITSKAIDWASEIGLMFSFR